VPANSAGGRSWPGLVIDVDATLVTAHSEKEGAAPTFKGGFGFHPLLAWCDNTDEALAGLLRPGNAGANTAADHIEVTDRALASLPDAPGPAPRSWSAPTAPGGPRSGWPTCAACERDLDVRFSVGFTMTAAVQDAIAMLPECAWTPAVETDGALREGADVAELTGLLPDPSAAGWPAGMRGDRASGTAASRRPAALHRSRRLAVPDLLHRHPGGQLAVLEARHRAHARVEDRIRTAKDTGLGRFPSREYAINAAWLELALAVCDLLAWARTTLLEGELAAAEPKTLRYRLLHVAARLTRGQRRLFVRIDAGWPWRLELAAAFARLQALPLPVT
jgi:hypothetical protein